jgi:hypothetical protein
LSGFLGEKAIGLGWFLVESEPEVVKAKTPAKAVTESLLCIIYPWLLTRLP